MTLQSPLAEDQYRKLRAPKYAGTLHFTMFPSLVVLAGQISLSMAGFGGWASFPYNSVSAGAYTEVEVGMDVFIGTDDDILQARYFGRVRKTPTSNIMYVNEMSEDFEVGTYFWVVRNYTPHYRLSRPSSLDPATAVELIDYDETFQQLAPQIVGVQLVYIGWVDPVTGKLRIALDASASYAGNSGATVSGFSWSVSGTVIGGNTSTAFVVVEYEAGTYWDSLTISDSGGRLSTRHFAVAAHSDAFPPQSGYDQLNINGSLEQGYNASVVFFDGYEVDDLLPNVFGVAWLGLERYGNTAGPLWSVGSTSLAYYSIADNVVTITTAAPHPFHTGDTVVMVTDESSINGTFTITVLSTTLFSYTKTHANANPTLLSGLACCNPQNVQCAGWLQNEDDSVGGDQTAVAVSSVTFQFTGIGTRLSRMASQLLGFTLSGSPTAWGEMINLTPWRAMLHFLQRYTTVTSLCDIVFDSTSNTFLFPAISVQGGSALEAVNGIAGQINARIEFAPSGALYIAREVSFLNALQRGNLPIEANWRDEDILYGSGIGLTSEILPSVGRVDGDGAGYNTATTRVMVFAARAPGTAQGEGGSSESLSAQILAASGSVASVYELMQRVGDAYSRANTNEYLDVNHPDGYASVLFIPSRTQLYTWTLDKTLVSPNGVGRIHYDDSVLWTVEGIGITWQSASGLIALKVRYRRVSEIGFIGDNITVNLPDLGEFPDFNFDFPAFDWEIPSIIFPDDPSGSVAGAGNGQELLVTSADSVFWLRGVISLPSPLPTQITPSDLGDFEILQPVISPFISDHAAPAFLLATDSENSRIWRSANVAAPNAQWQAGANTLDKAYTILRATSVENAIMAYLPSYPAGTGDYQFSGGQQGWTALSSTSFTGSAWGGFDDAFSQTAQLGIDKVFPDPIHVTSVRVVGTTSYINLAVIEWFVFVKVKTVENPSSFVSTTIGHGFGQLTSPFDITGSLANPNVIEMQVSITLSFANTSVPYMTLQLTRVVVDTPDLPFYDPGISNPARVGYSTDGGDTFSILSAGSGTLTSNGFDVQRAGGNSFIAVGNAVYRATTLGGAYSAYYTVTGSAYPVCIVIPQYNWSGAKQTAATNPDIIVALNTADGSSRRLLWIEGGATAGAVHNLTPVSGITFNNPHCIASSFQHHIAVFGTVSGQQQLYVTTNRGSSWSNEGTYTDPTFLRGRRNDTSGAVSGSEKGQLYLMHGGDSLGYSSKWGTNGTFDRALPDNDFTAFDTVY